ALEGDERRGTVQVEVRHEVPTTLLRARARPAGPEDRLGRPAGEIGVPEGGRRDGRHLVPSPDRLQRGAPTLAEGAIRLVAGELMREDAERPGLEGKGLGGAGGADGRGQLGLERHARG